MRTLTEGHNAVNLMRKSAAVTVAAVALATLPTVAAAHGGGTPFENCTAAYEAGHADIPASSEHYGTHLDRDGDGVGCDQPPSDFVAAEEETATEDSGQEDAAGQEETELAETGDEGTTLYVAAGGAAVLVAGAGVLVAVRRRGDAQR